MMPSNKPVKPAAGAASAGEARMRWAGRPPRLTGSVRLCSFATLCRSWRLGDAVTV